VNKFIILLGLLVSQFSFAELKHPKTVSQLKETSVRIFNLEKSSGGTGSIFRSYNNATHILTNKHICRLIEPGGVVDYKGKQYLVSHYKKFKEHDLCIVRIEANLGIDLEVDDTLAKESDKSVVSGHPNLLPHISTVGHLSEREDIDLVIGTKKCTEQDIIVDPMTCGFFGGMPVVKTLDSQLISNLIKPGNSGSAVFNKNGKLIGVVFAGNGRDFSFGYIVPQIYLLYFIQNAHRFEWVKVGTPVDDEDVSDRVFNFSKCEEVKNKTSPKFKKIKEFCKSINDTMIWRK
jgi:S1-C subfamily serine protease